MPHMDPYTHPALVDPMLMDGLESMGQGVYRAGMVPTSVSEPSNQMGSWTAIVGAGLDFLGKKEELDLQKDQIEAQLVAAQKAKEVALIQLEAAKVQREAAAAQATADAKGAEARQAGFGLDVKSLIMPIAIAGGAVLLMTMLKRRR